MEARTACSNAVSLYGPGAEDDDPRVLDVGRRGGLQRRAQPAEERREPVHARVAVERRQHPLADQPVLHRVARAGRRLRAVREDDEPAVLAAPEVGGVVEELVLARQADAVAGVQEAGVPEDDLGRDEAPAQQLARPVEVGEDEVEQLRALDDPALDLRPLARVQHDGHRVQPPSPPPAARPARVAVDDAVLVDQPGRLALAAPQLLDAEPRERLADVLGRGHARRVQCRGCSPGPAAAGSRPGPACDRAPRSGSRGAPRPRPRSPAGSRTPGRRDGRRGTCTRRALWSSSDPPRRTRAGSEHQSSDAMRRVAARRGSGRRPRTSPASPSAAAARGGCCR